MDTGRFPVDPHVDMTNMRGSEGLFPCPPNPIQHVGIPQFSKSKCQSKMLLEVACFKIKCTAVSSLRKKNFPEAAIQANFGQ